MDLPFLERFILKIAEQKRTDADSILSGRMKDFAEYRYAAGYLKGLDDAVLIAQEMVRQIQGGD